MKLELLTSPSYTKIKNLKYFFFGDTARESLFPASIAVPVLAFPSLHRIKVPNVACDVEDISVTHSNFKQYFAM